MPGVVLLLSGSFAIAWGVWRGYAAARAAILPLARDGEPTRGLIESTRPLHERARVRVAVRHGLLAMGWLSVAMYGLFMATVGMGAMR